MRANRFIAAAAALFTAILPARADQILGPGRITSSNKLILPGGPTLGTYQNGQFTSQPYNIQLQGSGSTGDVSGTSVPAPALTKPSGSLAWIVSWLFGVDSVATLRATSHGIFGIARTQGYYTPGDGGGAAYKYDATDTTSADDGCTVIVSTADGSRWKLVRNLPVELRQCGAKGDGSVDDTAAVRVWFALPGAIADTIGGYYSVAPATPFVAGEHTRFSGAGMGRTFFRVLTTNKTVFSLPGYQQSMSNFAMTAADGSQVAGSIYIDLSGPDTIVKDFLLNFHYQGILMRGVASKVIHGRSSYIQAGGIDIRAEGGDTSQLIDDFVAGGEAHPNVALACIRIRNSAGLLIANSSCMQQAISLLIDPYQSTQTTASDAGPVFSFNVINSFLDTGTTGIKIAPSGDASVTRGRFVNVWTSSGSGDGIYINNNGTGVVKGIYFTAHHSMFNAGSGITTGGNVSDIQIGGTGCFGQNAHGGYFNAGIDGLSITGGVTFGHCADAATNAYTDLVLDAAAKNVHIVGAQFPEAKIYDNMTAGTKVIANNFGYNPRAKSAATVGSSPWTYTNNTGAPVTLYVKGGAVSQITADGNTVASATNAAVQLVQGASATVTYSAAPTAEVRPN